MLLIGLMTTMDADDAADVVVWFAILYRLLSMFAPLSLIPVLHSNAPEALALPRGRSRAGWARCQAPPHPSVRFILAPGTYGFRHPLLQSYFILLSIKDERRICSSRVALLVSETPYIYMTDDRVPFRGICSSCILSSNNPDGDSIHLKRLVLKLFTSKRILQTCRLRLLSPL